MLDARSRLAGSTPRPPGQEWPPRFGTLRPGDGAALFEESCGIPGPAEVDIGGKGRDHARPPGEDSRHAPRNIAGPATMARSLVRSSQLNLTSRSPLRYRQRGVFPVRSGRRERGPCTRGVAVFRTKLRSCAARWINWKNGATRFD